MKYEMKQPTKMPASPEISSAGTLKMLDLSGSKLDCGEKVETEEESRTFTEHRNLHRQVIKQMTDDDVGLKQKKLQTGRGEFLSGEKTVTFRVAQQLPKDKAIKLDRQGGGGDKEEGEMDRGKPAMEEAPRIKSEAVIVPDSSMKDIPFEEYLMSRYLKLAKDDPTSQQCKESYYANGIIDDLDEELAEQERCKILFEKLPMIDAAHTTHPRGEEEVMALATGGSATTHSDSLAMKELATEQERFASHKSYWESMLRSSMHHFEDMTTLSPMHYTHLTPRRAQMSDGIVDTTLQIFSIKLAEVKGGFKWPLSVYGVVAARDNVDYKRNLLFSCDRYRSQTIKEEDPFLRLTGPSRAIVCGHPVDFEIQLKVKDDDGGDEDEDGHGDRALIWSSYHYSRVDDPGVRSIYIENCFCRTEFCLEEVRGSVQATIFGLRVANKRSWCFRNGCRVACSSQSRSLRIVDGKATYITNAPSEVVLLDCRHLPKRHDADTEGYLDLSRHVVSVDLHGSLRVGMQAYSSSGGIAKQGQLSFTPKTCNVSLETFYVGDIEMEISVAWSLLVRDKGGIEKQGWVRGTY